MKQLVFVNVMNMDEFETMRRELDAMQTHCKFTYKGYGQWYRAYARRPEAKSMITVLVDDGGKLDWNVYDVLTSKYGFVFKGEDL